MCSVPPVREPCAQVIEAVLHDIIDGSAVRRVEIHSMTELLYAMVAKSAAVACIVSTVVHLIYASRTVFFLPDIVIFIQHTWGVCRFVSLLRSRGGICGGRFTERNRARGER